MSFCFKCGNKLSDTAHFCNMCGEKVVRAAPKEETPTVVTTTPPPMEPPSERREIYNGEVHKCPHCGKVLKSFEAVCPSCGLELREISGSTTIKLLSEKLEKAKSEEQRREIVRNFHVPNTKEDIFEFLLLAMANFDAVFYATHLMEDDMSDAWLSKIELCYQKAELSFAEDPDFQKIKTKHEDVRTAISNAISAQEKLKKEAAKKNDNKIKRDMAKKFIPVFAITFLVVLVAMLVVWWIISGPKHLSVGASYDYYCSVSHENAKQELQSIGFSNITVIETPWEPDYPVGATKSVTIGEDTYFDEFDKFKSNVKIIIEYNAPPRSVEIGLVPSDIIGGNYQEVTELLEDKGFGCIELRKISWSPEVTAGLVTNISINGSNTFEKNAEYLQNAEIVLTYYAGPKQISLGISSKEIEGQPYQDIIKILEDKGFVYIEAREDGWHIFHKAGTVKSISINGIGEFEAERTFGQDARIIILYYK